MTKSKKRFFLLAVISVAVLGVGFSCPAQGEGLITSVIIDSVSSENVNLSRLASCLIDEDETFTPTGTSDDPTTGTLDVSERGWMTVSSDTTPWVIFDLRGVYNLTNIRFWNWNQAGGGGVGFVGAGIKTADISFASWDGVFSEPISLTLNMASGEDGYEGELFTIPVQLQDIQYVKLAPTSNYFTDIFEGDSWANEVGLGKIQFCDSIIVQPEQIPGDANNDKKVDGSDVTILAGNWQAGVGDPNPSTVTWEMGDFNGDGQVDGSDVTILAGNWQYGVTAATSAVPEPGTVALLATGLIALLSCIWRKRK